MTDYDLLKNQIGELIQADAHCMPLLSNASAVIYEAMEGLNWAGFYLLQGDTLVLGPFQGKAACIHIPVGKGVCGTAVQEGRVIRVEDVHQFPGHIACDSASQSEIVLPLRQHGRIIGIMDIDSPRLNRFSLADEQGLHGICEFIGQHIIMALP